MNAPVSDLAALLRTLDPVLQPGVWVYVTLPTGAEIGALHPLATFQEAEGLSLIVAEAPALAAGLPILLRCAWLTLTVHSDLAAVGLTAAVATALAAAGISCNMVAAAHHDHIFVPAAAGEQALAVLRALQRWGETSDLPPVSRPAE